MEIPLCDRAFLPPSLKSFVQAHIYTNTHFCNSALLQDVFMKKHFGGKTPRSTSHNNLINCFKGHCCQLETTADYKKVALYKLTCTCLSFHFLLIHNFNVAFCFQQQNASLSAANMKTGRLWFFSLWPRHPGRQGEHLWTQIFPAVFRLFNLMFSHWQWKAKPSCIRSKCKAIINCRQLIRHLYAKNWR